MSDFEGSRKSATTTKRTLFFCGSKIEQTGERGYFRVSYPNGDYSYQPSLDFAKSAAMTWLVEHPEALEGKQ